MFLSFPPRGSQAQQGWLVDIVACDWLISWLTGCGLLQSNRKLIFSCRKLQLLLVTHASPCTLAYTVFTCTSLKKQPLCWAYVHLLSALLNIALRGCVETCQAQHLSHQKGWNHSNHTYPQHPTSKSVEILDEMNLIFEHHKSCSGLAFWPNRCSFCQNKIL